MPMNRHASLSILPKIGVYFLDEFCKHEWLPADSFLKISTRKFCHKGSHNFVTSCRIKCLLIIKYLIGCWHYQEFISLKRENLFSRTITLNAFSKVFYESNYSKTKKGSCQSFPLNVYYSSAGGDGTVKNHTYDLFRTPEILWVGLYFSLLSPSQSVNYCCFLNAWFPQRI